jgi:hypothetical protein
MIQNFLVRYPTEFIEVIDGGHALSAQDVHFKLFVNLKKSFFVSKFKSNCLKPQHEALSRRTQAYPLLTKTNIRPIFPFTLFHTAPLLSNIMDS